VSTELGAKRELILCFLFQATIGIDFLSKTMYLEDRTVSIGVILIARTNTEVNKKNLCAVAQAV
jgi:hypothetical protein